MKIVAPQIGNRIAIVLALFLGIVFVKVFLPVEDVKTAIHIWTIPDQKTPLDGRNLAKYQVGETLYRCLGPSHNDPNMVIDSWKKYLRHWRECRSKTAVGRQFLLKNWENRTPAYLIVNNSYLDTTDLEHIFMEWDGKDWVITIRHERCQTYPALTPCITESEAFDVKLRDPATDDDRAKNGEKIISFVDKSGKEIFSL